MTIRFTTVEGIHKIVEVTEVEVEPIAGTSMETHRGKLLIREVSDVR